MKKIGLFISMLLGVIFIIIGFYIINNGLNDLKNDKDKYKDYIEINATIVGHDENSKRLQAIIVEYIINGKKYRKTSDKYTDEYKKINTTVRIKYNPANPEEVIWEEEINKDNIIFTIIGGVFIFLGASCVVSSFLNIFKDEQISAIETKKVYNTDPQHDLYKGKSLVEIANGKNVENK